MFCIKYLKNFSSQDILSFEWNIPGTFHVALKTGSCVKKDRKTLPYSQFTKAKRSGRKRNPPHAVPFPPGNGCPEQHTQKLFWVKTTFDVWNGYHSVPIMMWAGFPSGHWFPVSFMDLLGKSVKPCRLWRWKDSFPRAVPETVTRARKCELLVRLSICASAPSSTFPLGLFLLLSLFFFCYCVIWLYFGCEKFIFDTANPVFGIGDDSVTEDSSSLLSDFFILPLQGRPQDWREFPVL